MSKFPDPITPSRSPLVRERRVRSTSSSKTFSKRFARGHLDPGEAHPAVMLIAARAMTIRLLIDMPGTATDRQDLLAEIGARIGTARQDVGPLNYVFLAVEAWMVRRHEALSDVSPKEHPGRIEILSVVNWQSETNAYQVRIYRILRYDDGKVRDLVVEQDWEEARAYHVEAFVNAYTQMLP